MAESLSDPSDGLSGAATGLATPRRFACFNGLRAIAAVSVVLLHTAWTSGFTLRSSLGIYTSRFDIGVSVFFLISGFLLYRPFAVSHLTGLPAPDTRRFWVRRLIRIVPAYWLALTLLTYVFHLVDLGEGWQEVAIHYFFLQIYFPKAALLGIGPAWSICTEVTFYLFLPFYAAAVVARRKSAGGQLIRELSGLGVLVFVSLAFRWWALHLPITKVVDGHVVAVCYPNCLTESPFPTLMNDWLPARLDLFTLGMLLAVLSAWWSERGTEPSWLSHQTVPWVSWLAAAGVFWWVSHFDISRDIFYLTTPLRAIGLQELYGLFAFLILLPAVFGPENRSAIRRFLQSWPVATLGLISYGIYLWHEPLVGQFVTWTGYPNGAVPYWILALGVLALAIACAAVSYLGLERPLLRIKGRLAWWNRSAIETAPEASVLLRE